jgi:hypothetical protein
MPLHLDARDLVVYVFKRPARNLSSLHRRQQVGRSLLYVVSLSMRSRTIRGAGFAAQGSNRFLLT